MISSKYSFKFLSKKDIKNISNANTASIFKAEKQNKTQNVHAEAESDNKKRSFLKVAGIAGVGIVASQLLPKKAEALIMGSTPSSSVVGVKDSSNVRIDPAKEGGNLATIAGKDFATQTTFASVKTNTDKFIFDGENLKVISSGGSGGNVGVLDKTNTQISTASEEAIVYLRRIARQMESLTIVDSAQRQKVMIEAGTLPTVTTVTTVSAITNFTSGATLSNITTVNQFAGNDARYLFIDTARNAYANSIRINLTW